MSEDEQPRIRLTGKKSIEDNGHRLCGCGHNHPGRGEKDAADHQRDAGDEGGQQEDATILISLSSATTVLCVQMLHYGPA